MTHDTVVRRTTFDVVIRNGTIVDGLGGEPVLGIPARIGGLNDRGRLAVGYKADVNLIDADALRLHRPTVTSDLPAGGRRLDQTADGYVMTMVSGEVISENGEPTAARPGKLIRGRQPTPANA